MTNPTALRITSAPAITTHRQWDVTQRLLLAWGHGHHGAEVAALSDIVAAGYPAAAAVLASLG